VYNKYERDQINHNDQTLMKNKNLQSVNAKNQNGTMIMTYIVTAKAYQEISINDKGSMAE
jgi:hypothetical protein